MFKKCIHTDAIVPMFMLVIYNNNNNNNSNIIIIIISELKAILDITLS